MNVEYHIEHHFTVGVRPWGSYFVLSDEYDHKVKKIIVNPHSRLSLQRHQQRDEHWFIQHGEAVATLNGLDIVLRERENIDIPRHSSHRIANMTDDQMVFIEIQTGDYFGEDDIERLEDDYHRDGL